MNRETDSDEEEHTESGSENEEAEAERVCLCCSVVCPASYKSEGAYDQQYPAWLQVTRSARKDKASGRGKPQQAHWSSLLGT